MMLSKKNKKQTLLALLYISLIILGILLKVNNSYAQVENPSIKISQDFEMEEYFEIVGEKENISSIEINLGVDDYNITGLELNFTGIKMERQIKTIETEYLSYDAIFNLSGPPPNKYTTGLGMQIDLDDDTILYGVYIFGFKQATTTKNISIQIRGFDDTNHIPTDEILLNQTLNISLSRTWYYQNFTSPIPLFLPNNEYFIVLNASDVLGSGEGDYFHWGENNLNPKYPNLYKAKLNDNNPDWKDEQGISLLYKLDQKVNRTYNPQEIEMKAYINGETEDVLNGPLDGTGNLTLENIDFLQDEQILNIPIETNETDLILNFSIQYRIILKNRFTSGGSVLIDDTLLTNNTWTVNPVFTRLSNNYSIKFECPESWFNITVFKNDNPSIGDSNVIIDLDNNTIFILNDTITSGSTWNITANSEKIDFDSEINKELFYAGESLNISLKSPILTGNYNLALFSPNDPTQPYITINQEYPNDEEDFTFTLPNNHEGNWTAIIFWNNASDAGVHSYNFTISETIPILPGGGGGSGGSGDKTVVTGLDPILVFTIALIIIIGVVAGLGSYQTLKSVKRKRDLELQKLHTKFIDILSLNYLLVVDKKTGLNVYDQFFAGKMIDASLISGFFEAIRNFGIELTGTYQQSQTVKLEYQNSKIIMSEYRDFRIIFVMTENPSDDFLTSINQLSVDIQEKFGHLLQDFKGDTSKFGGISKLIDKNFNVSFIAPLRVIDVSNLELSDAEMAMINKAKTIMKQNSLDYFFSTFLLPEQTYDPKKTRVIFNLIEKKIFVPTNIK